MSSSASACCRPDWNIPFRRVGFISTRISGTDGVSLEIAKWTDVLERMGLECYFIAGRCDRPAQRSVVIPELDFQHPLILEITRQAFQRDLRSRELSSKMHELAWLIKERLYEAIGRLNLDLLIAENVLTIPMNLPLGAALVELLIESGIPCVAHHHDFFWERERFLFNAVEDYLHQAFPPPLAQIKHVVINSVAAEEFCRRTGLSCHVVPNVLDFDNPPEEHDGYTRHLRADLGLEPDDLLFLQPTRVVARKGIEHSIELVRRLDDPRAKLVITHSQDDEGEAYPRRVRDYARLLGVEVIFAADRISHRRQMTDEGHRQYSIWDAYAQADLVTYPSTYEGFGNAFLEAVYYRKPIFCNRYTIYRTDIEPCGFQAIAMDGFLLEEVVQQVRHVLQDEEYRRRMVEHNYEVAQQHFSYRRLEQELTMILTGGLSRCQATCRCMCF